MQCREQAIELLRTGWLPGTEPRYDADKVLVLCRMHGFREGLAFLYEKLRLFREILRVSLELHATVKGPFHARKGCQQSISPLMGDAMNQRQTHQGCWCCQVHMAAGDHAGVIETCMRLGDTGRGGDAHLWTDVLEYLAAQESDVTPQVSLRKAESCGCIIKKSLTEQSYTWRNASSRDIQCQACIERERERLHPFQPS